MFNITLNSVSENIMVVGFIGGRNPSTRSKLPTCNKSQPLLYRLHRKQLAISRYLNSQL